MIPRRLLIRADASSQIGSGHIMRMLALAEAWNARGGVTELLGSIASDALRARLSTAGLEVTDISRPHPDPADGARLAERAGAEADIVALDGYHFDPAYQAAARTWGLPVLVLDDYRHLPRYEADVLLNQNLHATAAEYAGDPVTGLLLGPRYALLRPEFAAKPTRPEVRSEVQRVLVMFGGGDPTNGTSRVVEALGKLGLPLEVTVLVAAGNPHEERIRRVAAEVTANSLVQVRLEFNSLRVREWMCWADMGVLAAGSTLWEAMATGLPSLLIAVADNQRPLAAAAEQAGASRSLGCHAEVSDGDLHDQLGAYVRDAELRRRHASVGHTLVDGRGASRVAVQLELLAAAPGGARLRRVDPSDEWPLLQLANEPTVRENSFSRDVIRPEAHREWFRRKLASPATRIWVVERESRVVGQIRYERGEDGWAELHFALSPGARGLGLGTWLLRVTPELAISELAVRGVRGLVLPANPASARAFGRAGFLEAEPLVQGGQPCFCFQRTDC